MKFLVLLLIASLAGSGCGDRDDDTGGDGGSGDGGSSDGGSGDGGSGDGGSSDGGSGDGGSSDGGSGDGGSGDGGSSDGGSSDGGSGDGGVTFESFTLSSDVAGVIEADASGTPGRRGSLGVADIDGDGQPDLLAGSVEAGGWYRGAAWWIAARDWSTAKPALLTDVVDATVSDGINYGSLGQVPPVAGDLDGDGRADFVVGGSDGYWSLYQTPSVAVFTSPPEGAVRTDAAAVLVHGFGATAPSTLYLRTDLDTDGDGSAELLLANADGLHGLDDAGAHRYPGALAQLWVGGTTGSVDVADGDRLVTGGPDDRLGTGLGGGDLDGDGYDEVVVAAGRDDSAATRAGAVYVLPGGSAPGATGEVRDAASLVVTGSAGSELGAGRRSLVADVDGDGAADLVVAAPGRSVVYVLSAAGADAGRVSAVEAADATITASSGVTWFGLELAAGDLDGDGVDELLIGAPETADDNADAGAGPGAVYVLTAEALVGAVDADAVGHRLGGESDRDGLGGGLLAADLDLDGIDELVVAAPDAGAERRGRLYFLDWAD